MFCIDYLLGYSSRGRQIVFLINIEETVSESNRDRAWRSEAWGRETTHTVQQTTKLKSEGKAELKTRPIRRNGWQWVWKHQFNCAAD